MKPLTAAQQRLLERIRAAGQLKLNGRARSMIKALADHGLIAYEYDLVAHALTGRYTESFTVRPAPESTIQIVNLVK